MRFGWIEKNWNWLFMQFNNGMVLVGVGRRGRWVAMVGDALEAKEHGKIEGVVYNMMRWRVLRVGHRRREGSEISLNSIERLFALDELLGLPPFNVPTNKQQRDGLYDVNFFHHIWYHTFIWKFAAMYFTDANDLRVYLFFFSPYFDGEHSMSFVAQIRTKNWYVLVEKNGNFFSHENTLWNVTRCYVICLPHLFEIILLCWIQFSIHLFLLFTQTWRSRWNDGI